MAETGVPPALAEVVGPLREADGYRRLQGIRQRGLYNLLTGAPGFLFVVPGLVSTLLWNLTAPTPTHHTPPLAGYVVSAIGWVLFLLSCFSHRLLLPWVRRRRPDWESTLLESSLVKKALEKLFWLQAPFQYALTFVGPLVLLPALLFWPSAEYFQHYNELRLLSDGLLALIFVAAMTLLGLQGKRTGDWTLQLTYWSLSLLAVVPFLLPMP